MIDVQQFLCEELAVFWHHSNRANRFVIHEDLA